MVQRTGLKKAAIGNKKAKRTVDGDGERTSKRKMGGRKVQRKGELDLSNPFIPADLDEDIDDDLAFNSDDEIKYGQFFKTEEEVPAKTKKGKKAAKAEVSGEFDKLRAYGENEEFEDDFSDDSREDFDLSEMLDSKEDRKRAKTARRSKRDGRKSAPAERLTREAESILGPLEDAGDQTLSRRAAGLHDLLHSAPDGASARRLEAALKNKKNLLTDDVDELVKERGARSKTRETVADKLREYTTVLNVHKDAAHLKFPLQVPEANPVPGTMGSLAASLGSGKHRPAAGGLESKMNELLKASGLGGLRSHDSHVAPGDQVKFGEGEDDDDGGETSQKQMSVGYMAKLKSMLSYEIAKRKRFNKIKSKTYRRILRKEKDREQQRRQKALELLNPEAARARVQEKMEKLRAEERATQKHKNTSKWVKHAKQFAKFDQDTKDAIDEQHALRQKLMSKMSEDASAEIADAADNMSESSEEEMRVDELLAGRKDAESILWQGADGADDEEQDMTPTDKARRDLMKMGFMARAKDRSNAQMKSELEALQDDIRRYHAGDALLAPSGMLSKSGKLARAALEDDREAEIAKDVHAEDVIGLEELYGKKSAQREERGPRAPDAPTSVTKGAGRKLVAEAKHHGKHSVVLQQRGGIRSERESHPSAADEDEIVVDETEERWEGDGSAAMNSKIAQVANDADEFAGSRKAKNVVSTRVQVLPISSKRKREEPNDTSVSPAQTVDLPNTEADTQRDMQQYLIARAFAMDDVDEDFLKSKEAQVESIMKPEDKNQSLPGWGEWGGEDERLNSQHKQRASAAKLERSIQMSTLMKARADAQLENVIINHDVDIVPDRQTLHMVPRPFSNPTEFSRSMRQPLGPEWNTSLTFKEGTQPRVTTTQGVAIDPLDLTSQKKKAKTIRRKLSKKSRE